MIRVATGDQEVQQEMGGLGGEGMDLTYVLDEQLHSF